MSKTPKLKRRLSDISFEHEGAHIALCSKEQQAANNYNTALIMKSTAQFSDEFIQKMQEITVTMELPDFLEKFFYLYEEEAEVLAGMMGWVEEEDSPADETAEVFARKKIKSYEVMKSLATAESIAKGLSELSEDEYLQVLKDQAALEKIFKKYDKEKNKAPKETPKKPKAKVIAKAKPEDSKQESTNMSTTVEVQEVEKTVEMVEKSQYESLQEILKAQEVELKKFRELAESLAAEKKAAVLKSRRAALDVIVKETSKAEVLFKALSLVEDEAEYTEVLKALEALVALAEKNELFVEKGFSVEQEAPADDVKESAVAKLIKSKHNIK